MAREIKIGSYVRIIEMDNLPFTDRETTIGMKGIVQKIRDGVYFVQLDNYSYTMPFGKNEIVPANRKRG